MCVCRDRERLHGVGTPFRAMYDIARVSKSDEGSYRYEQQTLLKLIIVNYP